MSSNIRINKICGYCSNEFIARKTTSRTCSDDCAKRLYKQKKREEKLEDISEQTALIKTLPQQEIRKKDFLTVRDVALLLNCSRQTVYTLINTGTLKATNLKIKKTLVTRKAVDKLFN